jgi:hypothetical protein
LIGKNSKNRDAEDDDHQQKTGPTAG